MRVLWGILQHYRTRWPEWALAWVLLADGVNALFFQAGSVTVAYAVLVRMAGAQVLGWISAGLGLIWLVALVANGTFVSFRRLSPWVRAVTGLGASCYWTMWTVTTFVGTGQVQSSAWIHFGGYALMSAVAVVMAAREVAHADQKAGQWKRILTRQAGGR